MYPAGVVERLERLLAAGDEDGVVSTSLSELFRVPPASLERMRTLPAWSGRVAAAASIVRELKAHHHYALRTEAFADVKVPTRLLLGGASPPFFKAALDEVQVALPQACVVVLPGQTHAAIDMAPELFANEVLSFLAEPDVQGSG